MFKRIIFLIIFVFSYMLLGSSAWANERNLGRLEDIARLQRDSTYHTDSIYRSWKHISGLWKHISDLWRHISNLEQKEIEHKKQLRKICACIAIPSLTKALYDVCIVRPQKYRKMQQVAEQLMDRSRVTLHTLMPKRVQSLIEQQSNKPEDHGTVKAQEVYKIIQFERTKDAMICDINHTLNELTSIQEGHFRDELKEQAYSLANIACYYKQHIQAIGFYKEAPQ